MGSEIAITVNRIVSESISCQAENTFTGQTATVVDTLHVSGEACLLECLLHSFPLSESLIEVLLPVDPHWCGC